MEWEQIVTGIKKKERPFILLIAGLIVVGVMLEYMISSGSWGTVLVILPELSYALLQIQATLTTLTIAVIALLSGNMGATHMGISIAKYSISIRPCFFKIPRIIVTEFIFLLVSIISCINALYNIQMTVFFADCVVILVSIFEILSLFEGVRGFQCEIEQYTKWIFTNSDDYNSYGQDFVDDWKDNTAKQSIEDFKAWEKVFLMLIIRMLSKENDIDSLNSISFNMVSYLLKCDNTIYKFRGLLLTRNFYESINLWINQNPDESKKLRKQIHLLDRIFHEWYRAFLLVEQEEIENDIDWDSFSETVIRVASCIGYDNNDNMSEMNAINSIAVSLGDIIKNLTYVGKRIDLDKWEKMITPIFRYYPFGVPENKVLFYGESLAIKDFNTCYGYIMNGNVEIIKNTIFTRDLENHYREQNEALVLRVTLIHCFMYYLAFRENEDSVEDTVRNSIKEVLLDPKTVSTMGRFLISLSDDTVILSNRMENRIENILKRYEQFPKHLAGKLMVMTDVVRDYYLYLALVLYGNYRYSKNLVRTLDYNKYFAYLLEIQQQRHYSGDANNGDNYDMKNRALIYRLKEISCLFSSKIGENDYFSISNKRIELLEQALKTMHKATIEDDARMENIKYKTEETEKTVISVIKEGIENRFLQLETGEFKNEENLFQWTIPVSVRGCDKKLFNEMQKNATGMIIDNTLFNIYNWLIEILKKKYGVEVINRDYEYKDDNAFIEYLGVKNYEYYYGNQYAFEPSDFKRNDAFSRLFEGETCNYSFYVNYGIAAREGALSFDLDDVLVDIHAPLLYEIKAKKNEETGVYNYYTHGAVIDFAENELMEYIQESELIVDVKIKVSLGVNLGDNNDGCVIIKKD